ncbi:MAG: glycoside hydrolase family 18 [Alistipes sp.]
MKNILKNKMILSAFCLALAVVFTACSDWTETESLDINKPTIEDQNPELYAQYLEALKVYKMSDHKIVYGVFNNNVPVAGSRAHHLTGLPDSVDMVCLMHRDTLPEWLVSEMQTVRAEKGTKTIYSISYTTIEALYKEKVEAEKPVEPTGNDGTGDGGTGEGEGGEDPQPEVDGFLAFCAEYMDYALALCDKYAYDGVSVFYNGRSLINMTPAETAAYHARQEAFFAKVLTWADAHADKMLLFEGKPRNVKDAAILKRCRYIVLRTIDAVSADELSFGVNSSLGGNIPADRYIVGVTAASVTDKSDDKGYFTVLDTDGKPMRAIVGAAYWVNTLHADYTKAGVMINNIQNDYYNINTVYKYTREAISIMNPSPKN